MQRIAYGALGVSCVFKLEVEEGGRRFSAWREWRVNDKAVCSLCGCDLCSRFPVQPQKTVAEIRISIIIDIFPFHLGPCVHVQFREKSIPGKFPFDFGQINRFGSRQQGSIKIRSADHENLAGVPAAGPDCGFKIVHNYAAVLRVGRVAGQDDVGTAGQGAADRFEGFSAHEDRRTHRDFSEAFQVGRQVPGHFVVQADDPVARHRDDK
jgi:hypothetical protein